MIKVLRWIAVLPAAVVAAALGYILAMLFNMLMEFVYSLIGTGNSWWLQILRSVISDTIFGAAFVWGGVFAAPAYKKITAVALLVMLGIIIGIMIALSLVTGSWIEISIAAILALAGGGIICYQTSDKKVED